MEQATLDEDDLFGEAAAEIEESIEEHLSAARAELPDAKTVWEAEADNVLGVLNSLRASLEVADAEDHLREAKKWYSIGSRADAFEDQAAVEESIRSVAEVIELIESLHEDVGTLTASLPQLREALQVDD